jgi:glutamate synthase (NADPH/NADH)
MGRVSAENRALPDELDTVDDTQRSVFPYQETPQNKAWASALPLKQGLYDPELEKDACGVGFAA